MKKSVCEIITERIIEQLENGVIPWQKPWSGTHSGAYNRISNKPYSLLNQMILSHDGEYASFKQWNDLGGKIKKGAKSEVVTFWKIQQIEEENENGEKIIKQIPLLRHYNVFHISQVEGVKPKEKMEFVEHEPIEEAERIKLDYMNREHLQIFEKVTNDAFYTQTFDYIEVPCKEQYEDIEEFYSTLFHEMIHSTGHKSRLDRDDMNGISRHGSEKYSKEELTAELGSAMILNMLGIETIKTFKNSTAYIQGWLHALKDDKKMIVSASSRAEKAVKYILNEQ